MTDTKFRFNGTAHDADEAPRSTDDYTPKYKWVRTWPGRMCCHTDGPLEDFITRIDGAQAGRIYRSFGTSLRGEWVWAGARPVNFRGKPLFPLSGVELTARQACRRAEEYWDAMCALHESRKAEKGGQ